MPNTGKPSPNCHLCRQRRVKVSLWMLLQSPMGIHIFHAADSRLKCDLGRPQCQRCIKYGVRCPGYRDEQDLRFQHSHSNTFEKRKSKKQRNNPDQPMNVIQVIAFTPESTASPASSQCSNVPSTPPLLRPVRQHWTAESIPLVLDCYSSINFLPGLFKGVPDDHCLVRTSQAFARAYVLNRYRPNTDYRELSSCLGKALASVSAAINDPKAHTSDATIVAVWFLGNYEVIIRRSSHSMLANFL